MILPLITQLEGVAGATFDATFTIYPEEAWNASNEPKEWESYAQYIAGSLAIGLDGKVYRALVPNLNVVPVAGATWEKLLPVNLTGFTGEGKVGSVAVSSGSGITLGGAAGTVVLELTPTQTKTIAEEETHLYILLKEPGGRLYEYVRGSVTWKQL